MDHVSVILVHFNQPKLTRQCLNSLAASRVKGFRVTYLVVDNGSSQPFSLPKNLNPEQFTLIRSDANLGFTGGNNLGIHTAIERFNSDFIVLLNNDTVVDRQWLQQLLLFSQANQKIGLVSPLIYFYPGKEFHKRSYSAQERGKVIWYAGGEIDWSNLAAFHRGVNEVDRGHYASQVESQFATGCCLLVKREVLEKIGFLDKRFFMYGEDVDFSLRAVKEGYSIGFCPAAKIWHINAGSSGGSGSELQQYYQERNRYLLAWYHGGRRGLWAMVRLQLQALRSNSRARRLALLHFYWRRFGKQPLY